MTSLTWLITGTSSGIGAALALVALSRGDKVIATSRSVTKLDHLKQKGAITEELDINASEKEVHSKIEGIIKTHGSLDVVVNNAGYGQFGSIEENGADLLEKQYRTNVFGPVKVNGGVLPHFRSRKQGIIINIGSRAAYDTYPFFGLYDSSKAALQNISITLDGEVSSLGIRSILVEPGLFKTNFLSSLTSKQIDEFFVGDIEDYSEAREQIKKTVASAHQKQQGDPDRLSSHLVDLAHKQGYFEDEIPPVVTFGFDSIESIEGYCKNNLERLEKLKTLVLSTDRYDW